MPATPSGGARRRRSRRGKGSAYAAAPKVTLTSVPTGRAAYTDTREWLLEQHGPVCAYCESVIPIRAVTLDHVTPRRGQTAYDRRDNLVLCCKACNAAKKDQAILAFLLGGKKRVIALYKYGQHLSHQLVEMVKDLLPPEQRPVLHTIPHKKRMAKRKTAAEIFGDVGRNASPYLDDSSPVVAAHVVRSAPVAHVAHVVPAAKVPAPRASAPKGPAPKASAPKKKRSRGGRGRKPKA
jgi:5-methylcytosine-specific restriction endonuclease McrA